MTTIALTREQEKVKPQGLGTFSGVYLPSVLTIFGVIMYLRLGYIVGSVGLVSSLIIVVMASSITLLTSLSIATSSTNMVVKSGGAYFLISRAFGKEVGAAVGLPLYLAQSIGIAFYITGFVEAVSAVMPGLPPEITGIATLFILTTLAFTSASLAVKTQGIIFVMIVGSIVSFFMGDDVALSTAPMMAAPRIGFWAAFALFFPAVTGIEAGVSMSGDLRNPSKSLVRGVILAVLTGLVVYLAMCWHLSRFAPRDLLRGDPFIVQHMARWGWMIVMGVLGATLSSGLGALLGAPRTLQALAQDGVVPRFLSKGYGLTNEPRIATIATFVLSGVCVLFGRIDVIAPLLTMFFLISYGMLNLAAGLEGLVQNPSWRPTFKVPAMVSIIAAVLCVMAMFMINPGISFVSIFLVIAAYFIAMRTSMKKGWDDIRQGILFLFSRIAIYRLSSDRLSARAWRPNFLVFINGYHAPRSMLQFTSRITRGKGILILASMFKPKESLDVDSATRRIRDLCETRKVEALVRVSQEEDPVEGMEHMVVNCGLGHLRPNTVVLGDVLNRDSRENISRLIQFSQKHQRNVVVIVGESEGDITKDTKEGKEAVRIDLWWDDDHKENSKLMLVLAHMHQCSKGYGAVKISVKCTVSSESAREHRQKYFDDYFSSTRFQVSTSVYVKDDQEDEASLRRHFSADAHLTLCGLRPSQNDEDAASYLEYYKDRIRLHGKLNNLVFVLASEPVDLDALFG